MVLRVGRPQCPNLDFCKRLSWQLPVPATTKSQRNGTRIHTDRHGFFLWLESLPSSATDFVWSCLVAGRARIGSQNGSSQMRCLAGLSSRHPQPPNQEDCQIRGHPCDPCSIAMERTRSGLLPSQAGTPALQKKQGGFFTRPCPIVEFCR